MNLYRKKNLQKMEPWIEGYDMTCVSVSGEDRQNGSPKEGDMIAINPKCAGDKWLVAKQFFDDNYEWVGIEL